MNSLRAVIGLCLLVLLMLSGCDSTMNGTYMSDGSARYGTLITSLTFKPGGKVDVRALGNTHEATYERIGKKIKIMSEGSAATILTLDENGCLDGGEMIGKLCKE